MAKILIVDDRLTNRELLTTLLSYKGHRLFEAEDGETGLEVARTQHPDLIITDIMMPKMDGYEFARQVRADPIIKDTQIIFYTSSYIVAETHRLAKACGVSIVIGKPIEPESFLKRVEEALATKQTPTAAPASEEFHREHMRILTDTLVNKVEQLEAEILEHENAQKYIKYQAGLLQNVSDAIVSTDMTSIITSWNPAAEKIYGWSENEAIGNSVNGLLETEYVDTTQAEVLKHFMEKRVWHGEVLQRRKDGTKIVVFASVSLMQDHTGKPVGMVAVNYDITERKQVENALRNREEQYRSLFEDSPISLWVEDFSEVKKQLEQLKQQGISDLINYIQTHPDFILECAELVKILDVNQAALKLYKASDKSQLLGNLTKNARNTLPEQFEYELIQLASNKLNFEREGIDQTLTGEEIHINMHWSVVPGYEASLERVIVSTVDITERKLAVEQLYRLNLDLEQRVKERTAELNKINLELEHANRAKDEFLANMSHELRTPLNSILGLSESLLEQFREPLTPSQQKSLQIIESSGRHLLDLINDILDISKLEAGMLDYYPQLVQPDELCKSSINFVKSQAMKKNIQVIYELQEGITSFYADPRRLKQILVNLLTNAVKFTSNNGNVSLKVNLNEEKEIIQFSVIDTGIGIAQENLKRLFTPFVQVESSLSRNFEGTGLGLALVQKLTDLHGGSVQVESEVGKGSRFTIHLPYRQGSIEIPQPEYKNQPSADIKIDFQPNAEKKDKKVLLVEDNESNILTIGEYLENHGYEVILAKDGLQAIEKAIEANPNIVLMDIQMPVMDGLEATRRLRADVRFASTPIIALTALAMPGDRERCLEAGATEYISKPVSLKDLRKMIENFLK